MTVAEAIALLEKENPNAELHVLHWAKSGGKAYPRIHLLAEVRRLEDGRLCLIEEDDRKLFLADR